MSQNYKVKITPVNSPSPWGKIGDVLFRTRWYVYVTRGVLRIAPHRFGTWTRRGALRVAQSIVAQDIAKRAGEESATTFEIPG